MHKPIVLLVWALAGLPGLATPAATPRSNLDVNLADPLGTHDDEGSDDEATDEPRAFLEYFETDPLPDPDVVASGQPLDRIVWAADPPAFPGDAVGSLTAAYDANAPAGLFGFRLPQSYDEASPFTAAAVFVIHSDGFWADPNGFFQISWGLWNSTTTGLERTGNPTDFAGDTFELIEFDYFPNPSPFFGGPFVGPGIFGRAAVDDPSFEFSGSFANFTGLFDLEVALPPDVPLLAVLEHRPGLDAMTTQVYRIVDSHAVLPLQSAVGLVPLDLLRLRAYEVDVAGLTLWHDGFTGTTPSLTATVSYHALVVVPRLVARPEDLLHAGAE